MKIITRPDGLIEKSNTNLLGEIRTAIFSPEDENGHSPYRYELSQIWDTDKPVMSWLMLNPSTADEFKNDPTVERCERRARDETIYGGVAVYNIFAFRATDPKNMRAAIDPIGPMNDVFLKRLAKRSSEQMVVGGWGGHGDHLSRGNAVYDLFRAQGGSLSALKTTKAGHPGHPLYIGYAVKPHKLF